MASRDWDKELKEIDKTLESVSDDALLPAAKPTASPAAKAQVADVKQSTTTFGVFARLVLAVALAVGMLFWPYVARCGAGLAGYMGAVLVVITAGAWTAVWTWRHRSARAHVLSLLLVLWGIILGAMEILPRVGYAVPTVDRPASWLCE